MKRYRLKKDWISSYGGVLKTGTELTLLNDDKYHASAENGGYYFIRALVESNTTWFEEIKEERIEVWLQEYASDSRAIWVRCYKRVLTKDKFPAIKKAIEDVLNCERHGIILERTFTEDDVKDAMRWMASKIFASFAFDVNRFQEWLNQRK